MQTFLVTGGTGQLGRAVVRHLHGGGHEVRVLSRRAGPAGEEAPYRRMVGNLRTGRGLAAAVDHAGVIVHCATTYGRGDIAATRALIDAALRSGNHPHLVYVSIVGVDRIPVPYYRAKLEAERVVAGSGLAWTLQRTTQFHDLPAGLFARQCRMPLTFAAQRIRFQPIDTRDVAVRLADLAAGAPAGWSPDIGGPHVRSMRELAHAHNEAHGHCRRVVSLPVWGRIARGFTEGANLVPQNRYGTITFEEFVAERIRENGR